MNPLSGFDFLRFRDGVSQQQRRAAALDPDYFALDERTMRDLLGFARQYATTLRYYNRQNENAGNWSPFLDGDIDEMVAFAQDPAAFGQQPEKKDQYSRPHFALFLTFLSLLRQVQQQVNTLTRRQLDFYFQQALGFQRKPGVADQVHLLAQLEDDTDQLLLPKGTLFEAGENPAGQPFLYQTDAELLVNRSQVARLMSLFVEKEVLSLATLREMGKDTPDPKTVFLDILRLTYRQKGTENTPRPYPGSGAQTRQLDSALVDELDQLYALITQTLRLRIPSFQRIMELYDNWQNEENWISTATKQRAINDYLLAAGILAGKIAGAGFAFADPRNFDNNFRQATGITIDGRPADNAGTPIPGALNVFDGLPEVHDIYGLYAAYLRLQSIGELDDQHPVVKKIGELHFQPATNFVLMMKRRTYVLEQIKEILRILRDAMRQAGLLPGADVHIQDYRENATLADLFLKTLKLAPAGFLKNDQDLRRIEEQVRQIEQYFRMPGEDFFFLRRLYTKAPHTKWKYKEPAWKWQRADGLLETAYRELLNTPEPGDTGPATNAANPTAPAGHEALPRPEIVRWKNLYLATDATLVVSSPSGVEEEYPRWKTFGKKPDPGPLPKASPLQFAELGFIVVSPALRLQEGQRKLTLTLNFDKTGFVRERLNAFLAPFQKALENKSNPPDPRLYPFSARVSTEKGWVDVSSWELFAIDAKEPRITLTVLVGEETDPLAPLADDTYPSPWPALQLTLSREEFANTGNAAEKRHLYEVFSDLYLTGIKLDVAVSGLRNLLLQNDGGTLDPKKAFELFGTEPETGDRFYFTHPELAAQHLESLTLNLEWKNFPEQGLDLYYAPYWQLGGALNIPPITNDTFQANLSIRESRFSRDLPTPTGGHKLFSMQNGLTKLVWKSTDKAGSFERNPNPRLAEDVLESDRYLQLELNAPGFQQNNYPVLLSRLALTNTTEALLSEVAKVTGGGTVLLRGIPVKGLTKADFKVLPEGIVVEAYDGAASKLTLKNVPANSSEVTVLYKQSILLQEPYTPVVKSLRIDYTTSVSFSAGPEPREDQLLHLHPFGVGAIESELTEQPADAGPAPKWRWRFLPAYDDEGQLFIGIAGLTPPQTLSLLFQMAEGSANPDRFPATVQWSCLCGGQWKPLGSEKIRVDTTQGLLNSGIVQLSIPAEASATHTRMPSGLHWLRAGVRRFSDSLSDTIAIHTQAVRATGISQPADPTRPFRPLPAGSIGEPVDRLPGLKTMLQPYTSFNGKPGEEASGFYQRASERLRHKQRALTLWDYERLVLEHFPDIYRAKALAADLLGPGAEPGAVTLVLIPDIRERRPFNPFEPKVPQVRLQEIRDFLQRLAPPFARIRTQNPRFDYISVRVGVRFQDMDNFDFYADRLQRELQQYLTPWAFDHAAEIIFGREIYLSVLVHFIESLPYVDYIDQPALTLLERRESDGRIMPVQDGLSWNKTEGYLQLRAPDILLVSAPRHSIEPLAESTEALQHLRQGVGYAKIELDFKIKPGA